MKFFFLIYIIGFVSCNYERSFNIVQLTEDSLLIDKSLFNGKFRVKSISGGSYFQGYNKERNEIFLIELDSSKTIFKVKPDINFADSIAGRLVQFDIYKVDSIFIVTENNIFIVNEVGKIIYDKNLSIPMKDKDGVEIVFWDNDNQFPLQYNSEKSELLLRTICNCSYMLPEYFHRKIEAKLSLKDDKIDLVNYTFPETHRKFSYGQAVFPFREVRGDLSIVSFQSDDSLYVFDRMTGEQKKYYCRSRYQKSDFIPFDTLYRDDLERVKEHLTVSPLYQKIMFDRFKNIYYRLLLREQSLKDEKGVYASIFSKDLIVMVLDKDFKVVAERNIGNSYSWFYSFVTEKGLYIRRNNSSRPVRSNNKYEYFTIFSWN